MELKTVSLHPLGTFSVLLWNFTPFAVSVECAPPVLTNGVFKCKRDFYYHGNYETFQIVLAGHNRVLFHKGNKGKDSLACVCVAESFTMFGPDVGIADSEHGFHELMELTKGLTEFDLTITGR